MVGGWSQPMNTNYTQPPMGWAVQCAVCSFQSAVYTLQCALVCRMQFAVYSVQYVVFSLQCVVFSLPCGGLNTRIAISENVKKNQ